MDHILSEISISISITNFFLVSSAIQWSIKKISFLFLVLLIPLLLLQVLFIHLLQISLHFLNFLASLHLCFPFLIILHFLSPSHSLYVSFYLRFSFAHFLSLSSSLFLFSCLPRWEFGKHSVSLMKEKCCFTPPALFWFEIKGNVKYPPDTHADIHSFYPLPQPLNSRSNAAVWREGKNRSRVEISPLYWKGEKERSTVCVC